MFRYNPINLSKKDSKSMKFVKITKKQQNHFDKNGYVIVQNVIDESLIKKVTKVCDKHMSKQTPPRNYYSNSFMSAFEPGNEIITKLICNDLIVSLMVQLMSPEIIGGGRANDFPNVGGQIIYKHPQKQLDKPLKGFAHQFVHPGYPSEWNWHRDLNNWLPNDPRIGTVIIKVAFCLTDSKETDSGSTYFVPGSHKYTEQIKINKNTGYPDEYTQPSVKAGDVYFFSSSIYHAVGPNFSDKISKKILIPYRYLWHNFIRFAEDPHPGKLISNNQYKKFIPQHQQLFGKLINPDFSAMNQDGWMPNLPLRLWAQNNGYQCDGPDMRLYK